MSSPENQRGNGQPVPSIPQPARTPGGVIFPQTPIVELPQTPPVIPPLLGPSGQPLPPSTPPNSVKK